MYHKRKSDQVRGLLCVSGGPPLDSMGAALYQRVVLAQSHAHQYVQANAQVAASTGSAWWLDGRLGRALRQ